MVRNCAPENLEVPDSMLTNRSGTTIVPAIVAGPGNCAPVIRPGLFRQAIDFMRKPALA
jgi:hypothetical protein